MSKAFDAVAFMRKRRLEIEQEDQHLSWEEKAQKTVEVLRGDPLWERLQSRIVEPGRQFPARREPPANSDVGRRP
jgi:hypothetical protein